jgi:DNA primase
VAAKPQLEKLPLGFFREMMFSRLRELTGSKLLDFGEIPTKLVNDESVRRVSVEQNPRSKLMRNVLSLLLQYPGLSKQAEKYNLEIAAMQFAGADLLRDVLQTITDQKPESSGVLIEAYRYSPQFKAIKALTTLVLNIPEGGEEGEFCGALAQLIRQYKKSRMDALIDKTKRGETLTPAEAQEYKTGGKF